MNATHTYLNSNGSMLVLAANRQHRPCAFGACTKNGKDAFARRCCRATKKMRHRVACDGSQSVSRDRDNTTLSNCGDGREREEGEVVKSNIVGVSGPILTGDDRHHHVHPDGGKGQDTLRMREQETLKAGSGTNELNEENELRKPGVGEWYSDLRRRKILGMKAIFVSWVLSLWRTLPYAARKWITNRLQLGSIEWPPMYSRRHVMLRLSKFLSAKSKADRPKLNTVGLDHCGRSISAFNALENWRLEELIGMGIRDTELFKCALTHPAAVKPSMRFKSYERLEYLGDAVLELAMRDILLERVPEADEGILTFQCQALTKGDSIRLCAAWLGLDKWILTNVFSMKNSLLQSPSVLGDAFEALVGAIYKDKGLSAAKEFLIRVFSQCPFTDFDRLTLESNYHAELSRKLCSMGYTVPMYLTLDARQQPAFHNGPVAILYTEQVYVNGRLHGIGQAYDQRIAQQFAAKNTLQTTMGLLQL